MENFGVLIFVNVLFLVILINSLFMSRNLVIRSKIKRSKMVGVAIGSVLILGIVIYWGREWQYYTTGAFGALVFIISSLFDGISKKGIQARSSLFVKTQPWNSLVRVKVHKKEDIILEYSGGRANSVLYFDSSDEKKLVELLNKNLSESLKEQLK